MLALAGIAALVLAQQLLTVGSGDLLSEAVTNAAHIPLFAMLTLLLDRVLGRPSWPVLALACIAVALATEALQVLTGRQASLVDLGLDMAGALPVIAALAATRRLRRRMLRRRLMVAVWSASAFLITAATLAAPAGVMLAYRERDRAFPVLLEPGRWQSRPLIASNSPLHVVSAPADWEGFEGRRVLSVVWADERYPGITLTEVVPDWSDFDALAVDVLLSEGAPVTLTAAVGHAGQEGTAAYQRRTVLPGPQRVLYDVPTLLDAAEGPSRITKLILHSNRAHAGRRLLIGRVELIHHGARGRARAAHCG